MLMFELIYDVLNLFYEGIKFAIIEIISILSTISKVIYEGMKDFYHEVILPII